MGAFRGLGQTVYPSAISAVTNISRVVLAWGLIKYLSGSQPHLAVSYHRFLDAGVVDAAWVWSLRDRSKAREIQGDGSAFAGG